MNENMKMIMTALAAGLFSAIVVLGTSAVADGNSGTDNVPKLIPYHGSLEKDGHGLNGAVKLHFRIFDGKTSTESVWDESLNVTAYNGKFTALLGSTTTAKAKALTKVITDADDLYLGVAVVKTDNSEIALSNRQRFLPVPYAVWTTASTDFKVGHDLTVENDVYAKYIRVGDTPTSNAEVSIKAIGGNYYPGGYISGWPNLCLNCYSNNPPDIIAGGKLVMNSFDLVLDPWDNSRGDGGRAMVMDEDDTLTLNYRNDFAGGTKIGSDLYVDGAISGRNLKNPDTGDKTKDVPGGASFGKWGDWAKCGAGYYVCGLKQRYEDDLGADEDDTGVDDIRILCCKF